MMHEKAIKIIEEYIAQIDESKFHYKSLYFKQLSFSKAAAYAIIDYIEKRKDMSVIVATDEFMRKMDEYACMNSRNSYVFSVMHDVAEYFLDAFIAM